MVTSYGGGEGEAWHSAVLVLAKHGFIWVCWNCGEANRQKVRYITETRCRLSGKYPKLNEVQFEKAAKLYASSHTFIPTLESEKGDNAVRNGASSNLAYPGWLLEF